MKGTTVIMSTPAQAPPQNPTAYWLCERCLESMLTGGYQAFLIRRPIPLEDRPRPRCQFCARLYHAHTPRFGIGLYELVSRRRSPRKS